MTARVLNRPMPDGVEGDQQPVEGQDHPNNERRSFRHAVLSLCQGSNEPTLVVLTRRTSRSRRQVRTLAKVLRSSSGSPEPSSARPSVRVRQEQRRASASRRRQCCAPPMRLASPCARWPGSTGFNRTTVSAILARAGIEPRQHGLTDAHLQEAARRYADGETCAVLARHFRTDPETVRQALRRAGVTMRRPGRPGRPGPDQAAVR